MLNPDMQQSGIGEDPPHLPNDGWSSQDVGPGNKGSDALATECVQCRNVGAFSPT
jgi:hypothetical protein